MLREIGLFDEKFFAYYEDVDIAFRPTGGVGALFTVPKLLLTTKSAPLALSWALYPATNL